MARKSREELVERIAGYAALAEQTLLEIKELDDLEAKYGADDYKSGDVITFGYRFVDRFAYGDGSTSRNYTREYKYAAIKCNGLWYTTGPKSPKAYTWDDLIQWWDEGKLTYLKKVTKQQTIC